MQMLAPLHASCLSLLSHDQQQGAEKTTAGQEEQAKESSEAQKNGMLPVHQADKGLHMDAAACGCTQTRLRAAAAAAASERQCSCSERLHMKAAHLAVGLQLGSALGSALLQHQRLGHQHDRHRDDCSQHQQHLRMGWT